MFKKIFYKQHLKYGWIDLFNLLHFNFGVLNIFSLSIQVLCHSVIFDNFEFLYISLSIFKFGFHLHFDVNWDDDYNKNDKEQFTTRCSFNWKDDIGIPKTLFTLWNKKIKDEYKNK